MRGPAKTWSVRYRDGNGIVCEVSTGCRDKQAARAVLNQLVQQTELVKAKVLSPEQAMIAEHQTVPLKDHIFDRDMKFAGVEKVDASGRVAHLQGLRYTFGTHLSLAGVAPRVAQAAMRHSSIDLTMGVYTDARLLETQAAVESLPSLPIGNRVVAPNLDQVIAVDELHLQGNRCNWSQLRTIRQNLVFRREHEKTR